MKKILLIIGVAVATLEASASYLYWQVDNDQTIPGNADYARLVYYVNGTYGNGDYVVASEWQPFKVDPGPYGSIDLSTITNYQQGAYFIEFLNYDGVSEPEAPETTWQVTGNSVGQTYAQLSNSGVIGSANLAEIVSASTVWTGSTYSVPEPTSGMMIMMALALLGLKRKQV